MFASGIKPNCSTMGADQFDMKIEQDLKESKQFFSYFYWYVVYSLGDSLDWLSLGLSI